MTLQEAQKVLREMPLDEFNRRFPSLEAMQEWLRQQEAASPVPPGQWQPIDTAPRDGTWILLAGPSGYTTTPLRVEVCRWYLEYRPYDSWQNHANDSFRDGGAEPTHWMPLPPPPASGGAK